MTDLSREMWYHGRISRTDAEKILEMSGSVEGSYLVRDSLTLTGEYVLSLCYQVSCTSTLVIVINQLPRFVCNIEAQIPRAKPREMSASILHTK